MKVLAFTFLLLILTLNVSAQIPGKLVEQSLKRNVPFTVTQYSTDDGLTQNQIVDIVENEDGALYLSTANGVCVFNGFDLKEVNAKKKERNNLLIDIFYNKKYKILFGLDVNSTNLVQVFPTAKNCIDAKYRLSALTHYNDSVFISDKDNNLYLATLPNFKLQKLNCKIESKVRYLFYINKMLYCATDQGLFIYNLELKIVKKISPARFVVLKVNPFDGLLYGVTLDKVFLLNNLNQALVDIKARNGNEVCQDIEFTAEKEFYLATTKGLFYYNDEYTEQYGFEDGLKSEFLQSLKFNKQENCLFVGTGEKGLLKLQFKTAYSIFKTEGLEPSSLNSIVKTYDGKTVVGENCCFIRQIRPDTIVKYSETGGSFASLANVGDELFCGTWGGGIMIFKDGVKIGEIKSPKIIGSIVYAVYKDSKGNIWIGSDIGLSAGQTKETIAPCFTKEINSKTNCIYELKNGNICIGGAKGFCIISNNKIIETYGQKEGLIAKEVRAFYEDAEGKIWVGTYNGGVYCLEKNKLTSINKMEGCFLFEDAFCLAPDNFGQIYMTSNYGLWQVSYNALNGFYKGKKKLLIPFHYAQENGILNTEFNGGFQNNFLKTKMDHFYFPTIEGIVVVVPDSVVFKKLQPRIESVLVNESAVNLKENILGRESFLIEIVVSCVNFSQKNNIYFQYKLIGNSSAKWSKPQRSNKFSFYQLPPGKYKFYVRAIDAYNDDKPTEILYEFEIVPYFFETFFFKFLAAFILIISIILISVLLSKNAKKKAEEVERIKRRFAELELKALQSQMNPHFMFNSLNSIKYFITINDIKNANLFIDNYALLMRKVLDYSNSSMIKISEEVIILEAYLALEKMRMNNAFDYKITVDAKLNNEFIPNFLLQPFIENAIKHGIAHSNNKCFLSLEFKEDEGIVCIVDDDGIGRVKSTEINKEFSKFTSKGIQLIEDKIKNIKEINNISVELFIEDKYSETGEALGTRVILKVPFV